MIVLAAAFMACAAALAMSPVSPFDKQSRPTPQRRNLAPVASGIAAISCLVLLEGWFGLVCAVLVIFGVPRLLADLERRQRAQEEGRLAREVPAIADMLASALAAGVTIPNATRAVADATDFPALNAVVRAQELGADPIEAWRTVPECLSPIGVAFARAQHTGAAAGVVLHGVADDSRRQRRTIVEIAARTAGVRAVAPLAACFLPAFLLLGVVPVVVTLADDFFRW